MEYWSDTHAHIYLKDFDTDRDDMIQRCREQGVGKVWMPNIDHTSIDRMLETELRFPGECIAMMGLHPCSVKKGFEKELYTIEQWLTQRKFSAIGEIGTDLYWDKTYWEHQAEAFRIQVGWAKKYNLPVVIHCRESLDQTLELLAPLAGDGLTGIFHCFTGTLEQAQKVIDRGFYLGIGGVATFKKGGLDTVLPHVDPGKLVLETDSPYLAPVPNRGKRNEPGYIPLIASRVMELTNMDREELMKKTTGNALTVFKS